MAKTYDFSYTNTDDAGTAVTPVDLEMVTNYAKIKDEPKQAELSNKTASMEQPEIVTYSWGKRKDLNTKVTPVNPAPVKSGVLYQVRVDSILRVTDGETVIDEPCAAWINICHPASDSWTNARVAGVVKRLIGACQSSDGASWRFEDLMRSALVPTQD